jgi:hypothetical protein
MHGSLRQLACDIDPKMKMWIMVSGPYSSNAPDEAARAENLRALNRAAVELFRMGHVPIVGVNLALPLIEVAGDASYDEIMMPLALAAADRCDAILRVGGASMGADEEVARVVARGKPVYRSLDEVPRVRSDDSHEDRAAPK